MSIDVLGNGGVMKRVLRPGTGKRPFVDGSVLILRYKGSFKEKDTAQPFLFGDASDMMVTVGSDSAIEGWNAALRTMTLGEVAAFTVASEYGYGASGVKPVIPPNTPLHFEVEVQDYKGNILMDSNFEDNNPLIPRTPATIKAEYERRQAERAVKKEGLEGFLEWARGIYVFGLFGESIETTAPKDLPWYLRPVITFPAMVVLVGVTYWLVTITGAITVQRPVDDVDNYLLSMVTAADGFFLS